jgi:hypothetical protein
MSSASKSILVFGIYIVVAGLVLIFAPNVLLGLAGVPPASDIWVRGFGIISVVLGLYYLMAARENNVGFYRMTLLGRVVFMLSVSAMGLLTPGYAGLVLFGLIDLAGAAWTWYALRQEANVSVQTQ